MSEQISYNFEADLAMPPEGNAEVTIELTMTPPKSSCIIYGYTSDTTLQPFRLDQSGTYTLPIVKSKIYIRLLQGAEQAAVSTRGFRLAL